MKYMCRFRSCESRIVVSHLRLAMVGELTRRDGTVCGRCENQRSTPLTRDPRLTMLHESGSANGYRIRTFDNIAPEGLAEFPVPESPPTRGKPSDSPLFIDRDGVCTFRRTFTMLVQMRIAPMLFSCAATNCRWAAHIALQ